MTALSGLAEGVHSFHVRAMDVAGNRDPSVASHGWTVQVPVTVRQPAGLRVVKVTWRRKRGLGAGGYRSCGGDGSGSGGAEGSGGW